MYNGNQFGVGFFYVVEMLDWLIDTCKFCSLSGKLQNPLDFILPEERVVNWDVVQVTSKTKFTAA